MASTFPSHPGLPPPDGGQATAALSALVRLLARHAAREAYHEAQGADMPHGAPAEVERLPPATLP